MWYHHDPLGTVTDLTDTSGAAQWRYEYEPYGSQRTATNVSGSAPENRLRFNGQYFDAETGNYHLRARQYDAALGRFGAPDAVENPLDRPFLNAYDYVGGQPTVAADPLGLCWNALDCGLQSMFDEIKRDATDAYNNYGGGVDGVVAGIDAANPFARAWRSYRETTSEHPGMGGAARGIAGLLGVTAMVEAGKQCGRGDAAACAVTAFSALAALCRVPFLSRASTVAGPRTSVELLSRAAASPHKGMELTVAGRALAKHTSASRGGSAFPVAMGNPQQINLQAQAAVESILRHPKVTRMMRYNNRLKREVVDITVPGGKGVRYGRDGEFIGFLEP